MSAVLITVHGETSKRTFRGRVGASGKDAVVAAGLQELAALGIQGAKPFTASERLGVWTLEYIVDAAGDVS